MAGLARVYGDREALTGTSGSVTYSGIRAASTPIAGGMLLHGVTKGTRVGLLYGNDPRWVVYWAALMRVGAICVPFSTVSTAAELHRLLRHSDVEGLIVQPSYRGRDFVGLVGTAAQLDENSPLPELVLRDLPFLRWVVVDAEVAPVWAHPRSWLQAGKDDPTALAGLVEAAAAEVHGDDEAICIYTSGQSATPKGVCHTHTSVATKIFYLRDMLGFDEDTEIPATLPFFWVGGLVMALFTAMAAGGRVLCDQRDPLYDGKRIGSSAPMPNPFAQLRVAPALGMTETFGMYSWGREWRADGHPLCTPLDEFQPGFDVRLVDAVGHDVPDGAEGEIVLRGPSVASRIYKVARSETFDADGFYRTGDRGLREGDRIHFLGRASDVMKVAGANVSPAEVERELLAFAEVEAAYVVGIEDERGATVVGAAVVLRPGAEMTASALRDRVAARLSGYKVPRMLAVVDAQDVPLTPSNKVPKSALAALISARSERARPR